MKFTPENIDELGQNEVFVFGSNEAGRHGAGAALKAKLDFGAIQGKGFGPQGQSFAIPTKDWNVDTLSLENINFYIKRFIAYANMNRNKVFIVTKIGCGLAGYNTDQIGGLFKNLPEIPENVILPEEFVV